MTSTLFPSPLPLFAVVIAGSHKIDHDSAALVAAAYEERSLIHQVVAPAGSALVFTEVTSPTSLSVSLSLA